MNGSAEREVHRAEAAEQPEDADKGDDERGQVEDAPRRRQLQRERDEDLADAFRKPLPPRQPGDGVLVEPAREEAIGIARVVREEPLQILRRQILRVQLVQLPGPVGRHLFHDDSNETQELLMLLLTA